MKSNYILFLIFLSLNLSAQEKFFFNQSQKFPKDSIQNWLEDTMSELSIKQPGFYRYTTKKRFDVLIDSTLQTINDSLTELEFYRKLKPLFSQIGCLHTGISLSEDYINYIDKNFTLLPLEVFIDIERKVFVSKNYSKNNKIPLKSEIVSINNKPIREILKLILQFIPSDGFNETEKILILNHHFSLWYQTVIELSNNYTVEVNNNGIVETYNLNGVSKKVFPSIEFLESSTKKQLSFKIKEDIGIIKIQTFSKSVINENNQKFKKFLKSTFNELNEKKIENLIIDLRYNTGGSDSYAVLFASYFFDKSFRYWNKIEITEAVAEDIKGKYRLYYNKPIKQDSLYLWQGASMTKEFDFYKIQEPAKNNYKGKVYIITNGLCLSSCSDLIAILSYNKKAIIVGQESGGGYQGNTSGLIPEAKIPTGLTITVPLLKYTNAVDLSKNFGRGTIPDYQITPSLEEWIDKKDVEMEFIMKLIKQ